MERDDTEKEEYAIPGPMGGVNLRTYTTELPEDQYEDLRNLEMSNKLGSFSTRPGTTFYGTSGTDPGTFGTNAVLGGIRFYYGATNKQLIVGSKDGLWKGNDTTGVMTQILSGLTTDAEWFFAATLDFLYCANGNDAIQRYDGTTVRAAGFPKPTTSPTVAASGAPGNINGAVQYQITFVYDSNAAAESSASTATTAVTITAGQVSLTAIPTGAAGSGVTSRNIYRLSGTNTTYQFVASIADNTTTTYIDNIADSSLGTSTAPTDNGTPPSGAQYAVIYHGRLVLANTSSQRQRVYFSSLTSTEISPGGSTTSHGAHPEIFPASHFIDVGDNNSPVTGLAVLNDELIIFKEDGIYNLMGDSAQDMSVWAAQATTGCIAPRSIVNMKGVLFFLGRTDGVPEIYSYDGFRAEPISMPIETYLQTNMQNLGDKTNALVQPCAARYRGLYLLTYKSAAESGYETAVLDVRPPRPRWSFWNKIEASCYIPWNGRTDTGQLFYGVRNQGQVLLFDSGTTDYPGNTITVNAKTKWHDFGKANQWKQIDHFEIFAKFKDSTATITLQRNYDWSTVNYTTNLNAKAMSALNSDHQIYYARVDAQGGEYNPDSTVAIKNEQGFVCQLLITIVGVAELYKIVAYFTAEPPEISHDAS